MESYQRSAVSNQQSAVGGQQPA